MKEVVTNRKVIRDEWVLSITQHCFRRQKVRIKTDWVISILIHSH